MTNEVLDHIVAVLLQFTDLLCVDVELHDIAMQVLQIFSGALEAEPAIVVGKGVTYLLNI